MNPAETIPLSMLLGRALRCRCPKCGEGKLYRAYLKPVSACSACGESYDQIRADDGPAWLTILLTGHIVVPLFVVMQGHDTTPNWTAMVTCVALLIALVFGLLPFTKAFFVAIIWRTQENRKTRSALG